MLHVLLDVHILAKKDAHLGKYIIILLLEKVSQRFLERQWNFTTGVKTKQEINVFSVSNYNCTDVFEATNFLHFLRLEAFLVRWYDCRSLQVYTT